MPYGVGVKRDPAPADYAGCPVTVMDALASGRQLKAPRWGLWDVLIALAIAFGATVVFAVAVALWRLVAGTDPPIGFVILVGVTVPWIGLAGWPLAVTAWRGNGPRIDLGLRLRWPEVGWGAAAGLVALVLAGLAAAATTLLDDSVTSSAAEIAAQLQEEAGRLSVVVFALAVVLGAPFVEEVFFRGLLFASLRKRGVSVLWTIAITSVAFAAFHLEPMRFLILLPTGIVLGWVRWRTGSLGAAMVAHGVVNAPGAVSLLLGAPGVTP